MVDTPQKRGDDLLPKSSSSAPLKPKSADVPENPSDKKLRRGLLITSVSVAFLFILILVIAVISAGQGSNVILEQLGITGDINEIILKVVNFVFGIAGIISLISVVIGGFIYVVSSNNPKDVKRARRILVISGSALIFLLFSYILIYTLIKTNKEQTPAIQEQIVQIQADPNLGAAPLSVQFSVANLPEGPYVYNWTYGDGQSGTGPAPSHEYKLQGQYTAIVVITSANEILHQLQTTITVENSLPQAIIDADPVSGRAPLTVNFDGSGSSDPNGKIEKYEWDFGDRSATNENPNTSTGVKGVHTYGTDGIYTVTLTITDDRGGTTSSEQQITVGAASDVPTAVITTTPAATGFAPLTVKGITPFKVLFSGSKSKDVDGTIKLYAWDFGDGSPEGRGQAVEHTYSQPGTYDAELTVTDSDNKTDSANISVVVGTLNEAPTAAFTSLPPATQNGEIRGLVPFLIKLDGSRSSDTDGEITAYEWNMGDNSPLLNGQTVEYTYTTAGTYTIALSVTDSDGYRSVQPATVKAILGAQGPQTPVAVIKTEPAEASGNIPFTVRFDGSDSYDTDGTILSYEWDFGDGTTIIGGAETTHVYDEPCICTVTLTVHDDDGLTGRGTAHVSAHVAAPIARIEANRTRGDAPVTVRFDGSSSEGNIRQYNWDFDDGSTARSREVQHTFQSPGTYEVTLIVTDTVEQVDDETITIEVQ